MTWLNLLLFSPLARWALPVATVVTLGLLYVAPELLSFRTELVVVGVLVVLLGLPHGALDPWIARQSGLGPTPTHTFLFNTAYLAMAALVVYVWYLAPVVSLLLFLTASAWHFSGDWDRPFNKPASLIGGGLIILMPISFSTPEVAAIFEHLSGAAAGEWAYTLAVPGKPMLAAISVLLSYMLYKRQWLSALGFASLALLAALATPLIYFTVYFCFQHSPNHLIGIFKRTSSQSHALLLRMLVVYTVASFIPLAALWWYWSDLAIDTQLVRMVFVGLAAVTVPHMVLLGFHALKQSRQTTPSCLR